MRSRLFELLRQFGAAGIWQQTSPSVMQDFSGHNRHAYLGAGGGDALAYPMDGPRWPGYDGIASTSGSPYVASIDDATNNAITLLAHIYQPTTAERGACIMLTNSSLTNGIGIGCGNGSDFASTGNTLMGLNETVAWLNSGASIGVGYHLIGAVCGTGTGNMLWFIDGVQVAATTLGNMNGGSVNQARVVGYYQSAIGQARAYTGIIGMTAYVPSLLTAGQMAALAACSRKDRALVAA